MVLVDVVIQIPFFVIAFSYWETDPYVHQNLMTIPKLWLVEEFGLAADPLLAVENPPAASYACNIVPLHKIANAVFPRPLFFIEADIE
jgi:hypothetical protein